MFTEGNIGGGGGGVRGVWTLQYHEKIRQLLQQVNSKSNHNIIPKPLLHMSSLEH